MKYYALVAFLFAPGVAGAWSACGHHTVALIAYDLLSEADQAALVELLPEHPRYAEDFKPSPKVNDRLRFRVGQTGYWPDVAREQPKYNRPKWHYQPGPALTIGHVRPPEPPGRLPRSATLDTSDLHISQALTLCGRVMADSKRPASERAIALSWIAHLVGDAHQPCHAGSLYAENVFEGPAGDRGGNEIALTKGRNLHALWDGLLGRGFDENRVRREVFEITGKADLMHDARGRAEGKGGLSPETWLEESREFARTAVYTNELLSPIRAAADGRASSLPKLQLSEEYRVTAGEVARVRVAHAGFRLAVVWSRCLGGDGKIAEPEPEWEPEPAPAVSRRTPPPAQKEPAVPKIKVWVTDSGEKYHREHCRYCNKSGRAIDLDAVRNYMEPCKVCHPPH